jgi:hypothetical protein
MAGARNFTPVCSTDAAGAALIIDYSPNTNSRTGSSVSRQDLFAEKLDLTFDFILWQKALVTLPYEPFGTGLLTKSLSNLQPILT